MPRPASPYDELPYASRPVPGTAPERLARASRLHGGPRPPARAFRLLEAGCGDGTNLLALAFYRPAAAFVGIDASARAIAAARAAREELGLANLRFERVDLAEPGSLPRGPFDYVLAHGVWSWVDERAREGLLSVARDGLAPGGLLYLSYNVRAGWIVRGLVRELVRDASAEGAGLRARTARAREVAGALLPLVSGSEHPFHHLLGAELERVAAAEDGYLAHEYLAPDNVAFDHAELVARLAAHGLAYVCDAWHDAPEGRIPPELKAALARLGFEDDALEQAADLIGHRRFRASVFCRAAARGADGHGGGGSGEAPAAARPDAHPRPLRLAAFEARRGNELTLPDHTVLGLTEAEREAVRALAAGEAPADPALVERLGAAGLLER